MEQELDVVDKNGIENLQDLPKAINKIFETNSNFHVKYGPTRNVQFLLFRSFWLKLKKKKKFLTERLSSSL